MTLDPRGKDDRQYRCKHVNLVTGGHVDSEKEYLFSAFSVFRVVKISPSPTPTNPATPHEITIFAETDNTQFPTTEDVDLELAPWC